MMAFSNLAALVLLPLSALSVVPPVTNSAVPLLRLPPITGAREHAAYLGVGLKDVTSDNASQLKLSEARGVEVVAVDRDGPSAAFLQEHDVILSLNGQKVDSGDQIRRILRESAPGRKAKLEVSRNGDPVSVEVVLGDRATMARAWSPALPNLPDMSAIDAQMAAMQTQLANVGSLSNLGDFDVELQHGALAGAIVESVGPQLAHYFGARDGTGVLVKEVRENTPAAQAGMKAGDFIIRAAGQPIPSRIEWDRRLRENTGKPLHVEVLRDHREQKLTLTLPNRDSGTLQLTGPRDQLAALQSQMASLAPEFARARALADDARTAAAKAQQMVNSSEVQQELQRAQVAAAQNLDHINPDVEKQMRAAQEELRRALEAMRSQDMQ